jgi:hypothetical protein
VEGLDHVLLERQLTETTADLQAFLTARDTVRRRRQEVVDEPWPEALLPRLTEWTGTEAVLGSLDLAIHAMERTIEELKQLIQATKTGRKFRVIEGDHGSEG